MPTNRPTGTPSPDAAQLAEALASLPGFDGIVGADLTPLPGRGIAHDHWSIARPWRDGIAVILRVPRLSQWGLAPETQLAYEAEAFRRAEPSGATPRIFATLPVSSVLPWGALLVERIDGGKPVLPRDLPAIARCLAAIHGVVPPPSEERPPLRVHHDPVGDTLKVIAEQAAFSEFLDLPEASRRALQAALDSLESLRRKAADLPPVLTLIGTDTHPGNFLVPVPGRAAFVDLEKAMYGNPATDLAHATLYTSTRWDPDIDATLNDDDVSAFLADYRRAAPEATAQPALSWFPVMRRLVWLRTTTWCLRWAALQRRGDRDWSARTLSEDYRLHIRSLVEDFLSPERLDQLSRRLSF